MSEDQTTDTGTEDEGGLGFAWGDRVVVCRPGRWLKVTLVGLVLAGIGGTLVLLSFEPQYEASAILRIKATPPYLLYPESAHDSSYFINTQLQTLRDPFLVVGPAINDLKRSRETEVRKLEQTRQAGRQLTKEEEQESPKNPVPEFLEGLESPAEWLPDRLEVTRVGKSELYAVSFTCSNAHDARDMVNAVIASYFAVCEQTSNADQEGVIKALEDERKKRKDEVGRQREMVRQLHMQATGKDPYAVELVPGGTKIRYPLAELREELAAAQLERAILEAHMSTIEGEIETHRADPSRTLVKEDDLRVKLRVDSHQRVQELRTSILEKQARLSGAERSSLEGKEAPYYRKLHDEITQSEAALEELRADLSKELREQLVQELLDERKARLQQMKSTYDGQMITVRQLQTQWAAQLEDLPVAAGFTFELEYEIAELERAQKVLYGVCERLERLQTEQGAPDRVSLFHLAQLPDEPIKSIPVKKMVIVCLSGFCLPFVLMGACIARARLRRRRGSDESVGD